VLGIQKLIHKEEAVAARLLLFSFKDIRIFIVMYFWSKCRESECMELEVGREREVFKIRKDFVRYTINS